MNNRDWTMIVIFLIIFAGTRSVLTIPGSEMEKMLIPKTDLGCEAPDLMLNALPIFNKRANDTALVVFNSTTEIKFSARLPNPTSTGQPRDCIIKCIDGDWIGPLCKNLKTGSYFPVLRNCELKLKNDSNYEVLINNLTVTNYKRHCPDHTVVQLRCKGGPGIYKQDGEMYSVCIDGEWSNKFPTCIPTSTLTNYSEESPPTVKYNVTKGSMLVDNENQLVVFPGSTLHLDCMYQRDGSTPTWYWANEAGNYVTGWTVGDDHQWTFRLSVFSAAPDDSGEFICSTPHKRTNSIMVRVAEIYCKEIHLRRHSHHLIIKRTDNRVGQRIQYSCPEGYRLIGSASVTCLDSGEWSEQPPRCHRITCPEVNLEEPHLTIESYSNVYGGIVVFGCEFGYRVDGYNRIRCRENGEWTYADPKCREVKCLKPETPKYGYIVKGPSDERYTAGTVIIFGCNATFELEGEDLLICTENGTWSAPLPTCERKCPYPGNPTNGLTKPMKYAYGPGEKLTVECDSRHVVTRTIQNITCLEDGTWSEQLPKCIFYGNII